MLIIKTWTQHKYHNCLGKPLFEEKEDLEVNEEKHFYGPWLTAFKGGKLLQKKEVIFVFIIPIFYERQKRLFLY